MSIDKFNSEGYYDPTAYEALSAIEKEEKALRAFRPIVYICSPFSGDVEGNIKAAQRYSRFAVDKGFIPIAPHLLFPQFLNDDIPAERQIGLFFGNALMSKCTEVWGFGSTISPAWRLRSKPSGRTPLRYFTKTARRFKSCTLSRKGKKYRRHLNL